MTWFYNKKVYQTFTYYGSQWAWANVQDLGWRRIKDGAADGCTNLHVMLSAAQANDKLVHVDVDASNLITTGYLV